MTGELSGIINFFKIIIYFLDNHDIVSVHMYEQEYARVERLEELKNRDTIDPYAESVEAPRDRVDDVKPSRLGTFGTIVFTILGICAVIALIIFSIIYFQKSQERSRKRFY